MAGRKPIPNELKKLRGTDQPVRMRDELSVEPITTPFVSVPKDIPLKTKRAKQIFLGKANQLIALRVLTAFDIESLSLYAETLDTAYTCMEELSKKDAVEFQSYLDKNENLKYAPNPYRKLLHECIELANKIGSDFGFTPVSRQRIGTQPVEKKDELQQFLDE